MIVTCTLTQVSAEDNLTIMESDESLDVIEDDYSQDVIEEDCSQDGVCSENNELGSYTELDNLIYNNIQLDLDKDYAYFPGQDVDYGVDVGILLLPGGSIDGHGHTIYGNGTRIFKAFEYFTDIKISNLNFVNIYDSQKLKDGEGMFDYGGAILNYGGITLENCTFINNYANSEGGAIYNAESPTSNLIIRNCTFICNSVNDVGSLGGAISSWGRLEVSDCKFYNCSGRYGGAIGGAGETYVSNCYFENNVASTSGGGLYNLDSNSFDVYNSSFHNNVAQFGGAIYNCIVRDCIFEGSNYASTKKGHNIYGGLLLGNNQDNSNLEIFFNVINSTGFSFKPIKLSYDESCNNETFDILVTNNLDGGYVPGIGLNVTFENDYNKLFNFLVFTKDDGIASIPLSNLSQGHYKVTISFMVNAYNATSKIYNLFIGKVDTKITFSTGVVFEYGSIGTIIVTVDGGTVERKNIKVLNHPEADINLVNNEVRISGLAVGSYKLQVTSTPDNDHFSTVGTIGISIKKATAVIKASKVTVALKKGTYWQVTIIDSKTGKGIANMAVSLKVYTGKKYKIVKVTTNSRGIASYKTSKLAKGNHKVVVSATHKSYDFNTLTSSIKVVKPKKIVISAKKKTYKKGSSLSIIVKDKATKKGLNGVKIKLLIYDGKKVKSVVLKTKKVGKNKGYAGYSTNELSVGKHKVKIVPVDVKYDGSKTSSMTIKKSAKKYPAESTKVSG